ncbi:MAG: DUF4105 domain-containing protein [Pseudomonadota bacterium]
MNGFRTRGLTLLLMLGALLLVSPASRAQEAYLVTYGPGKEVWELFGHNAIWIRDENQGIDHTFSFGYFELNRPGFYTDFVRGIMPYYGSASRIEREFAFYRERDRDIRIQRLALDRDQVIELFNSLHHAIFPQPQYYDYDYYWANCSTRLRDLIDEVTDGALASSWQNQPAERNLRDHTRALTRHRYFIHTGIQTVLGPMMDQEITLWDEAFLPQRLADALKKVQLASGPLVVDDRFEYRSNTVGDRFTEISSWAVSLGLGVFSLLLLLGSRRLKTQRVAAWVERLMIAAVTLAGLFMVFVWVASGHEATWRNAMLLVLNPLWLLWSVPLGVRLHRALWWVLALSAGVGAIYLAVPTVQYRLDALLWFVPMIGGLLWTRYQSLANR